MLESYSSSERTNLSKETFLFCFFTGGSNKSVTQHQKDDKERKRKKRNPNYFVVIINDRLFFRSKTERTYGLVPIKNK